MIHREPRDRHKHGTTYDLYTVRRTQIYLDDQQDRALSNRASASGRTKSALIRDAIDSYLTPAGDAGADLARLRAAVAAASGVAPLPGGSDYVSELRDADLKRERELAARRRRHSR